MTIRIDENIQFQQMEGFGASFTDSSAWLVYHRLNETQRTTLMTNLFSTVSGIGLGMLRQPMGASDFSASGNYSYDDMPAGQTDPNLLNFSIDHDKGYIIPVLRQALQLNPKLKIIGSPWSPPGWMKTSRSMLGGRLEADAYAPLANYFVKFIQAYQTQQVPINYVTVQNEPLYIPPDYPSMGMSAFEQSDFIKNYLGPAFAAHNINTKILAYDHNWIERSYPETILGDAAAAQYVSGIAWHCYEGNISAQTLTHNAYPNKDAFITECSGGTWEGGDWNALQNEVKTLIIQGSRNWAKSVILWNMALDTNNGPTNGGCDTCRGVVTINQNTGNVIYNIDYYALGHASKFIKPGAYRIHSNTFGSSIENVAFKNPDGSKVVIAYNASGSPNTFKVLWGDKSFSYTLNPGAAVTFTWSSPTSYTVSGVVKHGAAGLAGVTVKLASLTPAGFTTRTATTNSAGAYSFTVVPAGRNYTVTPTKSGYQFNPASRSLTNLSANQTATNFAVKVYSISGQLTRTGTTTGISAATVTLTSPSPAGFPARTAQTGSLGNYKFTNLPAGRNYTIKPTKSGFTFSPPTRSITNLSSNLPAGASTNFTGTGP
ncbi:MAG: glycoside hydrolase family 30 beta sandwich domain-containing protein [Pyrinomonadaceae bacterium]